MKKLIFPAILMTTLFFVAGCSDKFKIGAPYKDITVINAFLDKADTAHYIRIQKAFLDQDKSALTMAQTADSSFYQSLNVRIDRIEASDTSIRFDSIHLTRVDLTAEGYPKGTGVFFNTPNYAYKFKGDLDPNFFYRIVVTNLKTGVVDSAIAPIIDDVTPGVLYADVIDDTGRSGVNGLGMDFGPTGPNSTYQMNIHYLAPSSFNFFGQQTPAYVMQPIIRFNWADSNITTGVKTPRSYDFVLQALPSPAGALSYNISDISLYSAISSGMGTAPQYTVRLLDRTDIFVYVSTFDYYNYLQASLTQGVGLTGNEIEPVYTNIKGPTVLGLYTSRGMHTGKITITTATVDSLISSPLLTQTAIKGTVYH